MIDNPWDDDFDKLPSQNNMISNGSAWISNAASSLVLPDMSYDGQFGTQKPITSSKMNPLRRTIRASEKGIKHSRNMLATTMQRDGSGTPRHVFTYSRPTTMAADGETGHTEELAGMTVEQNPDHEVTRLAQPRSHCGGDPGMANCRREHQLTDESNAFCVEPYAEKNDFLDRNHADIDISPHLDKKGHLKKPAQIMKRPGAGESKKRKREYYETVVTNEAVKKARTKADARAIDQRKECNDNVK